MANTYTTIQGETWDEIAYKVYGSEEYASLLMASNYPFLDVLVFSAGTVLNTPDPRYEDSDELPPWRTGEEDDGDEYEDEDPYDDYSDEDEAEDDEE